MIKLLLAGVVGAMLSVSLAGPLYNLKGPYQVGSAKVYRLHDETTATFCYIIPSRYNGYAISCVRVIGELE